MSFSCTGKNCPMQFGFEVKRCTAKDCPYRTEPKTNADRIRAMTDEELAEYLGRVKASGFDYADFSELFAKEILPWLKEEVTHNGEV